MATKQVRNILNSQIDSVLTRAKEKIKQEGLNKVEEMKNELLTPEEIMKKLQVNINDDSCSPEGQEKFNKIYNNLEKKLNRINNILKEALLKLESIENTINPIINEEGPIGTISKLAKIIKENVVPVLEIIILAAPALLISQTVPVVTGIGIDQAQKRRDKAVALVKELTQLMIAIPLMILFFKKQAKKVIDRVTPVKEKIQPIKEQVDKLLLFMVSLRLQFEEGCAELNNSQNTATSIIPDPNETTPLQQYMSLLKNQYNDVYNKLQDLGNEKALKRVFKIKENLEEDHNISFKIVNFNKKSNKS